MTTTKRFLRRTACAVAVAGLIGVVPAGAAVAATGSDAPRAASGVAKPLGNPWIYIGEYQYKSTCDSVGASYHRQAWRCDWDAPVYALYVYYV
ncbi:hypothetical protein V2S66_21435 [Streptomyces sp. V4-01]|uniref:Secreted protein n=1 Tax=Actinacidiphila polyblastidii TaxID=3110430 RepID=A0ABU7PFC9_9ACTN|nr:hypothetical protein [Streptomyces sp. V4-01]